MKLLVVSFLVILSGCGHGISSGTGKKIGQVIQIGKHGMLCETWEGRLVRGGLNTGSGVQGGVFEFTVERPEMAAALEKAMEQQLEVELTYERTNFSGPCTSESSHFILDYKVLSTTTPSVTVR